MKRKYKILISSFAVAAIGITSVSTALVFTQQHKTNSLNTKNNVISNTSSKKTSIDSTPSSGSNGISSNSNYVVHNASGSMLLTLNALNNNTLSPNSNEVTAVVNSGDNVTLTAKLSLLSQASSTNTTATYQWYYVTTLPSDLNSKITSKISNSTQVQNATLPSLSLTSSQLAQLTSKTGIVAYYCEATITSELGSTTTYSGWYVLNTSSIISSSYTINSENEKSTSRNVAFTQNGSVSLGLTLSSDSVYSNISQAWYQSDSNSSDASFSPISDETSHILSVNSSLVSINKLNYFYNRITYTYNGAQFAETSDIFAVSNIQTTFTINSNVITSSNGYNYNLANSNTDNVILGGDISNTSATDISYQWYQDLKAGISNATEISSANSSTYEIKGNGGMSLINADYYEKITYSIDGIAFSVYSSPFYVTNIGFSSPGITINNSSSSNSKSSSSSSTNSNSNSGTVKSATKSSSNSSSTSSSTSTTLPTFSQNNAIINTFVDTEVSKAFSVTSSDTISSYIVSYAWYQGTTLLANETSSSYTPTILSTINDNSTVNYKLVITLINKTTNTTQTIDKNFILNIIALPTFTQTNNNINVISGKTNTTSFGVSTSNDSSNYRITYAWYEGANTIAIANASTSSFTPTISSNTSSGVVNYKVVITVTDESLGISTTMTKNFTLTIIPNVNVSIAAGNVSQIAYINGSYGNNEKVFSPTITLNDTKNYTLSYQWYSSNSANTNDGTKIDGATSSTYTPSIKANNGYYYLVVTAFYDNKPVNTFTSGIYDYYNLSYSIKQQSRNYSFWHADYKIQCGISTNDSSINIDSYSWKFDGGTTSTDIKNGTISPTIEVVVDVGSNHSISCDITIKINSISYEVSVPSFSIDTSI